jgi:hypothetical protein
MGGLEACSTPHKGYQRAIGMDIETNIMFYWAWITIEFNYVQNNSHLILQHRRVSIGSGTDFCKHLLDAIFFWDAGSNFSKLE